ncbi:hypothetical protein ASPFODRAFT_571642 [Aspergillus luchuensis CBS 106.47]|uniref:Secreted protein n=1 Tax=Aspergillus luchuensis (strain CBS 106.47) TaxID=1137211 RepID=A0A1M3TKZ9_ASPLC|nr:hypothetical protein ASPFODRAFT_571642 [Aspergillus luchuensis CBS 106.47]
MSNLLTSILMGMAVCVNCHTPQSETVGTYYYCSQNSSQPSVIAHPPSLPVTMLPFPCSLSSGGPTSQLRAYHPSHFCHQMTRRPTRSALAMMMFYNLQ